MAVTSLMEITRIDPSLYISCALFLYCVTDGASGRVIDQSVTDPMIIPECSHLVITEEQVNSFLGDRGQKCCMCTIGKRVKRQCNTFDPNSTLCEDCAEGTYIDHEPNSLRECHIQETCQNPHMVQIGGCIKSRARCECSLGYTKKRHFCILDKSNKITTVPPNVQGTPETDVTYGTLSHPNRQITHLTTATFKEIPTQSSDAIRNGLIVAFAIVILCMIIVLYYVAERKEWIPEKYHCLRGCVRSILPTDVLEATTSPNEESRMDEEINRTYFENIANPNDAMDTGPLLMRQPIEKDRRNVTTVTKKISNLEKRLRTEVFNYFAIEIKFNDLQSLAHQLLEPKKNAYEDIFGNLAPPGNREQKARCTFDRAVEINPNLSLEDINAAVGPGLGYLTEKIEEVLQKLKSDGHVA